MKERNVCHIRIYSSLLWGPWNLLVDAERYFFILRHDKFCCLGNAELILLREITVNKNSKDATLTHWIKEKIQVRICFKYGALRLLLKVFYQGINIIRTGLKKVKSKQKNAKITLWYYITRHTNHEGVTKIINQRVGNDVGVYFHISRFFHLW